MTTDTAVKIMSSEVYKTITALVQQDIREFYLTDNTPWVVCYSGGKDSTALVQLVFASIASIPPDQRTKNIHVISNNTKVENPAVLSHMQTQLNHINEYGKNTLFAHRPEGFSAQLLEPTLKDSFWVNLIGKGYPAPNRWFRWCTERLKINPTSAYIQGRLEENQEVIIVLGTRKAESSNRANSMKMHEQGGRLREHKLPNAFVYAPIADLSNDDVWAYLLQNPTQWGSDNGDLLELYGKASGGGECPLVIETGTQSCGKSRFGCWVCTVVDRDKSMENFITNGDAWLNDLLSFRNWLYDIRQETNQYVPNALAQRIKFSGLLLRTRIRAFEELMRIQQENHVQLISPEEQTEVERMLHLQGWGNHETSTKKYIYKLKNGAQAVVFCDFDILLSGRIRIGNLSLKGSVLIDQIEVAASYNRCTRAMFYVSKGGES